MKKIKKFLTKHFTKQNYFIILFVVYLLAIYYNNSKSTKSISASISEIERNYNESFNQSMELIKDVEGYRPEPYIGIDGKLYIGYGSMLSDFNKTSSEMSMQDRCDETIANNIFKDLQDVNTHFPDLLPHQKASIVSLSYSISRFKSIISTRLYEAIHNLDYVKIAQEWDFLVVNKQPDHRMQGRRIKEFKNFIKHLPESEQKELMLIQKNSFGLALNVINE